MAKDILPDLKHAYFKKTSVFSSQIYTCRTTYAFLTTAHVSRYVCVHVCMCPRRQKRMLEPLELQMALSRRMWGLPSVKNGKCF